MLNRPATRRLRLLSFDPSLAFRLDTSLINEITADILWEDDLTPGPVGEYIEVVDADPASGVFYQPVDLNNPYLLAQDGLAPSEMNPQFHQQMVYAVAMTTIRQFERALGRAAFWSDRRITTEQGTIGVQFVRRLRIYPHALRDRNAYYSPAKKALLFGYFPVTRKDADNTPGTLVFTCLSHDIIAHEVTHALLDGVHPRFAEPTNPDVLAFHEAFADIVALFQHFSYPAVLESQIRRTRGSLESENLLGQLAQQFGQATGRGTALRDALGRFNELGQWEPITPDPHALDRTYRPHDRGAILVASVFRAFLLMYRWRSADLFRIATQGTGVLPPGDMHPDLAKRLAAEAALTADRILQTCIRAIDYCPPVDVTFGDFLRALITADLDYAPNDEHGFRVVFIESFREWGIAPRGAMSMEVGALAWPGTDILEDQIADAMSARRLSEHWDFLESLVVNIAPKFTLGADRFEIWSGFNTARAEIRSWLREGDREGFGFSTLFGLVIDDDAAPPTVARKAEGPTVEVNAARPALRPTSDGDMRTDLVIELAQRRRGYFDPEEQRQRDDPGNPLSQEQNRPDFWFRTGCTIHIDLRSAVIRRVIRTRGTIAEPSEFNRVRDFLMGKIVAAHSGNAFDAGFPDSLRHRNLTSRDEPFALLHQVGEL